MRCLLGLIAVFFGMAVQAAEPVRIAIIIDDIGNSIALGQQAVSLPGAVTYAVLPQRPYSVELAQRAHAGGKEVMLHMPMQSAIGGKMGGGGLTLEMTRVDFRKRLRDAIASVPYVAGVNNHMGSLLTQYPDAMRWVMEDLSCYDRLYFVDSRTDVRTVARKSARDAGIANAQRDVFLDNRQEPDYVRGQLTQLIRAARKHGMAIGIGHPHPVTLAVLAEQLPRLEAEGVELVPVSRLVEKEWSDDLWYASSSPLPAVAKNSKPDQSSI